MGRGWDIGPKVTKYWNYILANKQRRKKLIAQADASPYRRCRALDGYRSDGGAPNVVLEAVSARDTEHGLEVTAIALRRWGCWICRM